MGRAEDTAQDVPLSDHLKRFAGAVDDKQSVLARFGHDIDALAQRVGHGDCHRALVSRKSFADGLLKHSDGTCGYKLIED